MSRDVKGPSTPRETRAVLRSIAVCYVLSGALGLVYQILWLRKLLLVFGSTVHAVSTVLTVFFGGLALGSWLFGRFIDRHPGAGLRWYAALELGVGLYAFLTSPLFDVIQHVYIPIYRASGFSQATLIGASFVCAAAILLVPTTLLGGTFPVLSRFLIRAHEARGATIANLYGLNTIGAMMGTVFVYTVGLPILGMFRTLVCAGVLNLGIGMLCLIFDRHLEQEGFHGTPSRRTAAAPGARGEALGGVRWVLLAFALSGFSAMVYEVAWTRALSLVLGSSVYAFCVMLATFLGGIALGSFWVARDLHRRAAEISQFIRLELMLGAYGFFSIWVFPQLPDWLVSLWPLTAHSFSGLIWLQVTLSAMVMILPTIMLGALFPVVSDLVTKQALHLGRSLGTAYAINTAGGIVGSFFSGFILVPALGLPWAIVVAAIVNLVAGLSLYIRFGRHGSRALRVALATLAVGGAMGFGHAVVVPAWHREVFAAGAYLNPEGYRRATVQQSQANVQLLYYRDSLNATVSVHREGERLFLKVGGKTDASTGLDMGTQVLSAHLPLLLHPDPHRVLVIGLGSGVTLGHAGRYPLSTIHCAELDPAVIEGARYFKAYNYAIHEDPRTTIFAVDGRNFLLASPQDYDVIISEPSNPWMSGLAYLFTQEFYELARGRLAPHGLMCQWVQLYTIFPEELKLILKTFHEVFPYVTVWSSIPGDLLVIGSLEPQRLDAGLLASRMAAPAIQEGLKRIRVDRPETLLQLFWMDQHALEALTADIPWTHQDDRPSVEFNAPKALYAGRAFAVNADGLAAFKTPLAAIISSYDPSREDAAFYISLAGFWDFRGESKKAKDALERAVTLNPKSSEAWARLGEVALTVQQAARAHEALTQAIRLDSSNRLAYRLLAKLHWQQGELAEAQRFYDRAARLEVPDGALAEEVGNCLREAKQFASAAEYYRSAISQGRGDRAWSVLVYLGALKEAKRWNDVEAAARVGMRAFPQEGSFPLFLGEALFAQGRMSDAVSWFRRTLTLAPRSAEAYYGLGQIAAARGERAQAMKYLQRGLLVHPYHHDALQLLDQLQHGSGAT